MHTRNIKNGLLYSPWIFEADELVFIKTKNKKDLVQHSHFDLGNFSAQVKIPDDAEIKQTNSVFLGEEEEISNYMPKFSTKTYFILSDTIEKIEDWKEWEDPDFCWDMLKKDPGCIAFIKHPTEDMCLIAVKQNGLLLQFIKEEFQTNKIGYKAIHQNYQACDYLSPRHPFYSEENTKTLYQACCVYKNIWPITRTTVYDYYGNTNPC